MVSEDSQDIGWLSMIHRLRDLGYLNQAGNREVLALLHETKHRRELLEVLTLRSSELVLLKERDDHVPQIRKPRHAVPVNVFPVIVMPAVHIHLAASEEACKAFQHITTRR